MHAQVRTLLAANNFANIIFFFFFWGCIVSFVAGFTYSFVNSWKLNGTPFRNLFCEQFVHSWMIMSISEFFLLIMLSALSVTAVMAEWLRRWTRNPMGNARAGSNPARSEKMQFVNYFEGVFIYLSLDSCILFFFCLYWFINIIILYFFI